MGLNLNRETGRLSLGAIFDLSILDERSDSFRVRAARRVARTPIEHEFSPGLLHSPNFTLLSLH